MPERRAPPALLPRPARPVPEGRRLTVRRGPEPWRHYRPQPRTRSEASPDAAVLPGQPGGHPDPHKEQHGHYAGGGEGCGQTIFAEIVQAIEIVRKNLQTRSEITRNGRILSTPLACRPSPSQSRRRRRQGSVRRPYRPGQKGRSLRPQGFGGKPDLEDGRYSTRRNLCS